MSAGLGRCVHTGCFRTAVNYYRCWLHELTPQPVNAEYEAARLDPTTDRDRWDVWDDGGLEAPGEDEW